MFPLHSTVHVAVVTHLSEFYLRLGSFFKTVVLHPNLANKKPESNRQVSRRRLYLRIGWSRSAKAVCRWAIWSFRTAMARAFFVPTSTTSSLARVIAV